LDFFTPGRIGCQPDLEEEPNEKCRPVHGHLQDWAREVGLTFDQAGNLYGTTFTGGAAD
jgi:hypothetical protein